MSNHCWIKVEQRKRNNLYTMPSNEFHEDYEIYYLLSGERNYFIENRTYHIESGDLVLINKHDLHKTFSAGDGDYERFLIFFGELFLHKIDKEARPLMLLPFRKGIKRIRLKMNEQNVIEKILFELIQEQKKQMPGFEAYMEASLSQLLLYTGRLVETYDEDNEPVSSLEQKMQEIIDYINHHYDKDLNLTSVSHRFYLSPYYLSRVFKQITSFSFIDYINTTRIKNAQRLLRETNDQVTEIAAQVGFQNIAHFGRVFKAKTNMAPLQYRNLSKTK